MSGEMVMRSVYLPPDVDAALRVFAREKNLKKEDVIRAAIASKLEEWEATGDRVLDQDLTLGSRSRTDPKHP
jgi:predicted transcriptional regulator